jgi:hypothetical protein|tara:strand:+ start:3133 stop:3615 length:483 start_codon:yes stop_codon:yes gene_type:complete
LASVYVREAHPGVNYSAIRSLKQKLAHARVFREKFSVQRSILVDDVSGSGHQQYGLLPNMVCLVNRACRVNFRADWKDEPPVKMTFEHVLASCAQRKAGRGYFHTTPKSLGIGGMRLKDLIRAYALRVHKLWMTLIAPYSAGSSSHGRKAELRSTKIDWS